jgi:secreted trypsin-like serine protease
MLVAVGALAGGTPAVSAPAFRVTTLTAPPPSADAVRQAGGGRQTHLQIVGGSAAEPGAYPSTAWVAIAQNGTVEASCTGSVIGDRWLLTAAHCLTQLTGPNAGKLLPGLGVGVLSGTNDLNDPSGDVSHATKALVASGWDPSTAQHDFALLLLDHSLPTQAVTLVRADQTRLLAPGTLATLVGWGLVTPDAADIPNLLQAAQAPILGDPACSAAYPGTPGLYAYQPAGMVCAGFPAGGVGTCHGDSGGPLLSPDGPAGLVLVGVTSWGGDPCAGPAVPSVFTRLTAYSNAILGVMEADATDPVAPPAAVTGAAGSISSSSASITGSATPNGLATRWRVEYGATPAYGQVAERGYVGDGHLPVALTGALTGLAAGTIYHYRVDAESAAGIAAGQDATFTTAPPPAPSAPPATPLLPAVAAAPPANPAPKAAPLARLRPAPCAKLKGKRRVDCLRLRARRLRAMRRAKALRACNRLHGPHRTLCLVRARRL